MQTDADLTDEDEAVLNVFHNEKYPRANPYLLREETGLDKGTVNTVLNRLARKGIVKQRTRGLYDVQDDQLD